MSSKFCFSPIKFGSEGKIFQILSAWPANSTKFGSLPNHVPNSKNCISRNKPHFAMDAPLPHTDAMAPAPVPLSAAAPAPAAAAPPPAAIIAATTLPPAAAGGLPAADMPPTALQWRENKKFYQL